MNKKWALVLGCLLFSMGLFAQNNDWQKLAQMGRSFYEKGEFESAYQAFSKAKELAPKNSILDNYLAQSAYRAGKFQEASEAYKRGSEKKSDTWTNYNRGNSRFKNQDLNGAIDSYKEALRKDPNNQLARHNLAQALKKQQQENKQNQDKQNQDKQNNQDKNKSDKQNQDKQNQGQNQDKQNNQDNDDKQNQQEQAKMGKEQTDQLLESMMQADKKAKEKLKEKGKSVGTGKREKDW